MPDCLTDIPTTKNKRQNKCKKKQTKKLAISMPSHKVWNDNINSKGENS